MSVRIRKDDDNHDFEFAKRGLVATFQDPIVVSDFKGDGEVVWNTQAYDFLEAKCPATANASLWRQGQLCSVTAGLYHVTDGVYQVRGLDLSNMSFVQIPKTDGIVIIDCLTSVETARRGLELYQQYHKGKFGGEPKIKALLYTHCHADHFGGAQAIADKAGKDVLIFGPDGFLEHAVSENVYAGPAMSRRSIYMYGEALNKGPAGQIGSGLGQTLSSGTVSLVAPNQNITEDGLLKPGIDGLEVVCQLTPGTEAPAEVNFFFPAYSALCMAENATHTLHNIQTLRGAPVRDARLWSRYMDESISLFGAKTDVVFASHHWPTWNEGQEKLVVTFLEEQRDNYAYLHNETLRQLNDGKTPVEIAEDIKMPPTLSTKTNLRGYYGSINHNVKGIYDKYMGWFDGNPANLWALPPVDEASQLVECMGGGAAVLDKAREYVKGAKDSGDKTALRFAATLLNKLVFSDADNKDAKAELASVYTTLGHGAENGTWRNIYLTGADELQGTPHPAVNLLTPSSLKSLSLDQLFDTVAIRIDGPRACAQKGVTVDFMVEDMKQLKTMGAGWHLRLSNGAVTGHAVQYVERPNPRDKNVSLTVWALHETLVSLVGKAAAGEAVSLDHVKGVTTAGDIKAWGTVTDLVVVPNSAFNIVTP
ncbi:hypothetical protein G6O67_003593 [Ophiocordyceps sinensis]|uniref:Metallo-beta-lactamase domain-containing protein n=2 Tax=Ophiocordyceps sinensis TaxID=72228 RepID=A0A8H4V660_9HYPO|nr:beta-lactamase domain-containing protein [Ophiocordyceps sinensis CO18]KAF4509417.1 hypothetical protein G6O67_003593 [Ophiocordyceps sinensis]